MTLTPGKRRVLPLLFSLVLGQGCAEELDLYQAPAGLVHAVFDPSASPAQVPTPTDLVRDPVSGRLALPVPACDYLDAGPFTRVSAAAAVATAPTIKATAGAFRVTPGASGPSYLRLNAEAAGAHVLYLDTDVKLEVLDAKGKAVTFSSTAQGVAACALARVRHVVELAASGVHTIKLTPAAAASTHAVTLAVARDTAQLAFNRYLSTLDGYPTSATAEMMFSGLVDTTTLTSSTVRVYDVTGAGAVPVTGLVLDAAAVSGQGGRQRTRLRIFNPAGWKRGARYALFVLGGVAGVKAAKDSSGKGGQPVIRAPLFELATGARPLCVWDSNRSWDATSRACATPTSGAIAATGCCTHNHSSLIASSVKATMEARADIQALSLPRRQAAIKAGTLAAATTFERMRQGFVKLLQVPAAAGVAPADVALLWTFTTSSMNEAIFAPAAAAPSIPLPSDLLRNAKTGMLNLPVPASATTAEKEWIDYLNSLDGWLTSTPATLSLLDDLYSASVTPGQGLAVFEVPTSGAPVAATGMSASWDSAEKTITLSRKGGWKRGTRYVVAALGGAAGLKNAATKASSAPRRAALMDLALSPHALCTWDKSRAIDSSGGCTAAAVGLATGCCTKVLVSSFIDDPDSATTGQTALARATRLEALRQQLSPLVNSLARAKLVTPADLVALWSFTTASLPELIYDPTTGQAPFPSDLLLDSKTGKVSIPAPPGETAPARALRLGLNTLDGLTTQGAYLAPYHGKLDFKSLMMGSSIIFVDLTTGLISLTGVKATLDAKAGAIVLTPSTPLAENRRYGLALISSVTTASPYSGGGLWDEKARRVAAAPFMALARSSAALYSSGKSAISSLDSATAKQAEQARLALKPLMDVLIKSGIKRQDVAAAWTLTTQTITAPLTRLRALPWDRLANSDGLKPTFGGTLAPASTIPGGGTTIAVANIGAWVGDGAYTSVNALNESGDGTLLSDLSKAPTASVPFILTLPKKKAPATGYPVVMFQHGLSRHKADLLALADALASKGMAAIAFDTIYSGARSWCTADLHCDTGKCVTTTGKCATGKLLVDADGLPHASGARFLNLSSPFAVRDNMRQHVVDAAAMLRGIALGAAAGIKAASGGAGGVKLDPNKVYYVGQSMGGILGPLVLATTTLPSRAVLNTAGSPVTDILFNALSTARAEIYKALGVTPGTLADLKLRTTYQWILDPADPGNFARYLELAQLPDRLSTGGGKVPKKDVVVQLAAKDLTVPLALGQRLAGLVGIGAAELSRTTFALQGHSFLITPSPKGTSAATAAAQGQVATFLRSGKVCLPNTAFGTCQ